VPGTHEYIVARTKYFDDLFKQALADNIPQVVFLGAGYDTRSIRFKDSVRETKIFELDVPTTQKQKKDLLLKAGISVPEQLSFVLINFNKESMQNVLSKAGYDKSQKVFSFGKGLQITFLKKPSKTHSALSKIIQELEARSLLIIFTNPLFRENPILMEQGK
jgi:methyltransferase (TIGR00027 family)